MADDANFTIKQGSRLPGIESILRAPGIHQASGVEFRMRSEDGATVKTGTAVIDLATLTDRLDVHYDWGATDTDTVGRWHCEWWVTIGGKLMKVPHDEYLIVDVLDDVAN